MEIKVAENIKNMRKAHGLTQEQLADALGVSIGAVYKWESGQSMPELKILMEIADLFETSVDSLLGYVQQSGNVESRVKRIQKLTATKNFTEAVSESDKALKKYPNNFRLVYTCAFMYMVKTTEDKCRESMIKSNELFEKALTLFDKNAPGEISEVNIKNFIATNYLSVGDTEKALEIFKENNIRNINSSLISYLYAVELKEPGESIKYAKRTVIDVVISMSRTIFGISFAYALKNDRSCISSLEWLSSFLDSFKTDPDSMVYTDKFKTVTLALLAVWEETFGQSESAAEHITEAYKLAKRFDGAPVYNTKGMRFADESEGILIDSFGKTVCEAVEKSVFDIVPKTKASRKIRKLWEELKKG